MNHVDDQSALRDKHSPALCQVRELTDAAQGVRDGDSARNEGWIRAGCRFVRRCNADVFVANESKQRSDFDARSTRVGITVAPHDVAIVERAQRDATKGTIEKVPRERYLNAPQQKARRAQYTGSFLRANRPKCERRSWRVYGHFTHEPGEERRADLIGPRRSLLCCSGLSCPPNTQRRKQAPRGELRIHLARDTSAARSIRDDPGTRETENRGEEYGEHKVRAIGVHKRTLAREALRSELLMDSPIHAIEAAALHRATHAKEELRDD